MVRRSHTRVILQVYVLGTLGMGTKLDYEMSVFKISGANISASPLHLIETGRSQVYIPSLVQISSRPYLKWKAFPRRDTRGTQGVYCLCFDTFIQLARMLNPSNTISISEESASLKKKLSRPICVIPGQPPKSCTRAVDDVRRKVD